MKIKHPDAIQVLLAIDQLANTLVGGYADESLSSHAWRMHARGKTNVWRWLIDHLFFWQEEHCYQAYLSEKERTQLPPEFRGEGNA